METNMGLNDPDGGDYGYDELLAGVGLARNVRVVPAHHICKLHVNVDAKEKDKACHDVCKMEKLQYRNVYEDGCHDDKKKFNCMCVDPRAVG